MQKFIVFLYTSKSNWKMQLHCVPVVPAFHLEPSDDIFTSFRMKFRVLPVS